MTPCSIKQTEIDMFTKTKIAMAALLIAAFATPSFAGDRYHAKHQRSYAPQSLQLIEGRNSAVFGAFGTSTDRETMVQATGN
jgi:hypothetical protein